ncbi:MAG: TonB-dependent receptor [Micropepsaceae bacterium]
MLQQSNLKTLKSALMTGAALATVAGFASAARAEEAAVEKVTVTGSRIPQKGLTSVSPVTTVTAQEGKLQGTTSPEQLLNSLPQVLAGQSAEISNGASGTATVDLRGLGAVRTLVLINGRRLAPAANNPNTGSPVADLHQVPLSMVDRVEVLTGGASAVYGADAIGGVVNFIMRRNFEGAEVSASYGIYDHDNDSETERSRVLGAGFGVPDEHVNDGRTITVSGAMGANTADGRGNVTLYAQYRHAEAVLQSERDETACVLASDITEFVCRGSANNSAGIFTPVDGAADPDALFTSTLGGDMVEWTGETFNFGPSNYLQRPDNRYLFGAMGHYELAADADIYAEISFADDHTFAQIAPSGLFYGSGSGPDGTELINCDNPFLLSGTAGTRPFDAFCGPTSGLGATDSAQVYIGRRFNVELGGRVDDLRHTSYRGVTGLRGDLDGWGYDVYAQFGSTIFSDTYTSDLSVSRIAKALQVVPDPRPGPGFGLPVCKSVLDSSDPNCIPLNIFQLGQVSTEAAAYISTPAFMTGESTETVANASMNGELGAASPWAETQVSVAFGGEYRLETYRISTDAVYQSGDLTGQGGATPSVFGHYDVWEAFGEVEVPLVEDAPMAKLLAIYGGYRISDYDNAGITHTYKYGAAWAPVDDLRIRGTFQRAVRAPNVVELFTPQRIALFSGSDPCAGAAPSFSPAECLNLGVSALQYSNIIQCPAGQCAQIAGGNPNLKPEESDTISFGFVFTPKFMKGFSATVDYYDIELNEVIQTIVPTIILSECAATGNPEFCNLVTRTSSGILFGTSGAGVNQTQQNTGSRRTSGVDVEATYKLDLGAIDMDDHSLTFNLVGTYVESYEFTPFTGAEPYECVGLHGWTCGTLVSPTPDWRHKLRATWSTDWDVDLSVAWRHISESLYDGNLDVAVFNDAALCDGPCGDEAQGAIPAYNYIDLAFSWAMSDHITLLGGVNNVTDEVLPLVDNDFATNGNSYPETYDALGREAFISMTTRF